MLAMGLTEALKQRAIEVGFDLVGIAPPKPDRDLEFARAWVERGYGGEMDYLGNPERFDPREVLPSVKSVICVGLIYDTPFPYSTEVRGKQKPEVRSQESEARSQEPAASSPSAQEASPAGRGRPDAIGTGKGLAGPPSSFQFPVSSFEFPVSNFQFPVSHAAQGRAWISRYAWGRDYHEIMREKLERLRAAIEELAPGVETRVYVDTGPIIERAFARFSGVGWMGKNTCIINEEKGSWFFLGVILTNLELEPALPAPDRCGSCRACLDACPTRALVEPYVMDASRCISYLTIELKGPIPPELRPGIGRNLFGCDICQDVCPWNRRSQESEARSQERSFEPMAVSYQPSAISKEQLETGNWKSETGSSNLENRKSEPRGDQPSAVSSQHSTANHVSSIQNPKSEIQNSLLPSTQPLEPSTFSLFNPPLDALASLTENDFRRLFAHSPIKRAKYRGWLRNLCVAMGNSGDERFIPRLKELAAHPDPIVREHAAWALGRRHERS